jgi:acetyl-CoA acetyltransferase
MASGRRVAIVGVGFSPTGRNLGLSNLEMTAMSSKAAMEDAGISHKDIDGLGAGVGFEGGENSQFASAESTAEMLGLSDNLRWFNDTGGPAYLGAGIPAIAAIASGSCDLCLTYRTMRHPGSSNSTAVRHASYGGALQFTVPFGGIAAANWASMTWQRHMAMYGSTADQLGYQAVAQREFAALNERALHRKPLTIEDYLSSRYISRPLRLYDCEYPISGSGAVIYASEERARDLAKRPVFVESWAMSYANPPDAYLNDEFLHVPRRAAQTMWDRSDLTPSDVDVAGLYDGFTVHTLTWLESLGLCGEGEAGSFVEAGNTKLGGKLPINCDGGTLNMGRLHGVNHVIEVTRQLRGESGARQTPDAEVGVCGTGHGIYAGCVVLTRN